MSDGDAFYTKVCNCARCGNDHEKVFFVTFTRAPEGFTHWGTCPISEEPILMTVSYTYGKPEVQA